MTTYLLLITGMAIVTYIPRMAPLMLLSAVEMPPLLLRWLTMIPPAVLAALLAPELLLQKTNGQVHFFLSLDNLFLLAAIPTIVIGWRIQSFFGTVAIGMFLVALFRYCGA